MTATFLPTNYLIGCVHLRTDSVHGCPLLQTPSFLLLCSVGLPLDKGYKRRRWMEGYCWDAHEESKKTGMDKEGAVCKTKRVERRQRRNGHTGRERVYNQGGKRQEVKKPEDRWDKDTTTSFPSFTVTSVHSQLNSVSYRHIYQCIKMKSNQVCS